MSISARMGYRKLLRSAQKAFHGDNYAIYSARLRLREEFFKNKVVKDNNELSKLIAGIEEVDEMLNFNIVQGVANKRGNFEVKLRDEHLVTVESKKDNPLGAEMEVLDNTLAGGDVRIDKSSNKNKKLNNANIDINVE